MECVHGVLGRETGSDPKMGSDPFVWNGAAKALKRAVELDHGHSDRHWRYSYTRKGVSILFGIFV